MKLELIPAYDRIPELSELIREYTDAILAQGDDVRKCLAVQHLDEELRDLPRKYAPPYSRLYLAVSDNGTPAGCAAVLRAQAALRPPGLPRAPSGQSPAGESHRGRESHRLQTYTAGHLSVHGDGHPAV